MTRIAAVAAFTAWMGIAQIPSGGEAETITGLIRTFGPWAGLVGFFVWLSWMREKSQTARNQAVEDSRVDLLKTTVEKCTEAMLEAKEAFRAFADATRGCPGRKE